MATRVRYEQCRVYKVVYTAIGRNGKSFPKIEACVVAMDVTDLSSEIRNQLLGSEITNVDQDGLLTLHEVIEHIEIESAELIGRLHGITSLAFAIINED